MTALVLLAADKGTTCKGTTWPDASMVIGMMFALVLLILVLTHGWPGGRK